MRPAQAAALAATTIVLLASQASAGRPPWVERRESLPGGNWAFDVGLGLGHVPDRTAPGVNMEMAVGITEHVELGVRTGLRLADDPGRAIEPDNYGRLFDRQYFDGGASAVANPELRVRWRPPARPTSPSIGLEGRFIVPLEAGTYAGIAPGLPIALHLGDRRAPRHGRLVPFIFDPTRTVMGISVPVDIWIQVSPRVWLGPMTGLQDWDVTGNRAP